MIKCGLLGILIGVIIDVIVWIILMTLEKITKHDNIVKYGYPLILLTILFVIIMII